MSKTKTTDILPYVILAISISSINVVSDLSIGNTILWWCIYALIYIVFIKTYTTRGYKKMPNLCVKLFLLWVFCSAVYGAVFMTRSYWDWKLLVSNVMVFSLPIAIYIYNDPQVLTKTLKIWFRYAIVIYIFLIPFLYEDAHGRYLVPFTLLALCFFSLNLKYKILVVICYVWIVIMGIDDRSNTLKFTVCLLLSLLYLIKNLKIKDFIFKSFHIFLLITPIILFVLASVGIFNIFKIDDIMSTNSYTIKNSQTGSEYSIADDTRTFLYEEEIRSAIKNDYVWFGHSLARGYDSYVFGWEDRNLDRLNGERQQCEASILNIFNYFGIIGVLLYLWIFIKSSYLAIYKSKNIYIQIVGLYIAFRWLIAWIEDFSNVDLNYLFLWILVAMCFSPAFRSMTDMDFKKWLKSIEI